MNVIAQLASIQYLDETTPAQDSGNLSGFLSQMSLHCAVEPAEAQVGLWHKFHVRGSRNGRSEVRLSDSSISSSF